MISDLHPPPASIEAERILLGNILFRPAVLDEIRAIVRVEDFYQPEHAKIFDALLALHDCNIDLNPISLRHKLTGRGQLDEIGGAAYIAAILQQGHIPAHARYHASIIREQALRRRMIQVGNEITQRGFEAATPVNELLSTMDGLVAGLRPPRDDQSEDPAGAVRDILEATIDGRRMAVDWPWPTLGRVTKALLPGTVTLICGDPGTAKSFLLLEAAQHWHTQNVPVAILELEEGQTYHLCRALAQRVGDGNYFDDSWIRQNPDPVRYAFAEHREFLKGFANVIQAPREGDPNLKTIVDWVRRKAKAGTRIIGVDPITAAGNNSPRSWEEDRRFMMDVKAVVEEYQCSLVLVSHPIKGRKNMIGLDALAGGAAYQRFSQCVIWIEQLPDWKEVFVKSFAGGACPARINRITHVCKTRNGMGCGLGLGFTFRNLVFSEHGIITREPVLENATKVSDTMGGEG